MYSILDEQITKDIKDFSPEGFRDVLSTVTCVNISSAISDFFFLITHMGLNSQEFLGILHSLFRILSPRMIHWGQEVSKLKC